MQYYLHCSNQRDSYVHNVHNIDTVTQKISQKARQVVMMPCIQYSNTQKNIRAGTEHYTTVCRHHPMHEINKLWLILCAKLNTCNKSSKIICNYLLFHALYDELTIQIFGYFLSTTCDPAIYRPTLTNF